MQIFNIFSQGTLKSYSYVTSACGGSYTRKEAYSKGGIGAGGLRYVSGIPTIDSIDTNERFRANIELFKNGLGVYVRSLSYNYLLAIPAEEIQHIRLAKEEDLLHKADFSFTHKLLNWGMSYNYAKIMLLDHEIGTLHDILLTIETVNETLVFSVKRYNPSKLNQLLQQSIFSKKYELDMKEFRVE